jgi:hypothetical protein
MHSKSLLVADHRHLGILHGTDVLTRWFCTGPFSKTRPELISGLEYDPYWDKTGARLAMHSKSLLGNYVVYAWYSPITATSGSSTVLTY